MKCSQQNYFCVGNIVNSRPHLCFCGHFKVKYSLRVICLLTNSTKSAKFIHPYCCYLWPNRHLPTIIMSSPKSESELKGGHPPAVKAGGMRITQHKTRKDSGGLSEDTTGLTITNSPPKTLTISGAVARGHADFPTEAVQSFHKEKPPSQHAMKPQVNIQQPRK